MRDNEVSAGLACPQWSEPPTLGCSLFECLLCISSYSACLLLLRVESMHFTWTSVHHRIAFCSLFFPSSPLKAPRLCGKSVSFQGSRDPAASKLMLYIRNGFHLPGRVTVTSEGKIKLP